MSESYGQYLLNQVLPEGYKVNRSMKKSDFQTHLQPLARNTPKEYVRVIADLKRLGDEMATLEGVSVGVDDVAPEYEKRNPIIQEALNKIHDTIIWFESLKNT